MGGPERPHVSTLIDLYATRSGLNNYKLSLAIGLLPGNIGYSAKQVERLRNGRQRPSTPGLLVRLVEVLKLSEWEADELWFASGMIPDDWDFDIFHRAQQLQRRRRGSSRDRREDREVPGGGEDPPRMVVHATRPPAA